MKSTSFILSILLSLGIYASQSALKSLVKAPTQLVTQESITDSIVRDTVINRQGVKLSMLYDNARHRATFVLHGETINLTQDTVASGIIYRNAEYKYTEHQGNITLKKGDKILFSYP